MLVPICISSNTHTSTPSDSAFIDWYHLILTDVVWADEGKCTLMRAPVEQQLGSKYSRVVKVDEIPTA